MSISSSSSRMASAPILASNCFAVLLPSSRYSSSVRSLPCLQVGVARIDHDVGLVVDDPLEVADRRCRAGSRCATGSALEDTRCARPGTASSMWPMRSRRTLDCGDLDAAAVADDAAVADPLVLAAVALPVLDRTEDALAEQTVLLRLERPVVDGLRLRHFAVRPLTGSLRARRAGSGSR